MKGGSMKNYLPIVIGILVIIAAGFFVRQYSMSQVTPLSSSGNNAVPTETQEPVENISITPIPTEKKTEVVTSSAISLAISSPTNNITVTSKSLVVRGKTIPKAEVFVNDAETRADDSGSFSVTLTLDEGENYILVVANDADGNFSEKELTITYTP
jgi:hypothetical protein